MLKVFTIKSEKILLNYAENKSKELSQLLVNNALEEIIIDVSFNRQEYSEAEAQSWLDSEAPPEARTLYQKKFENMVKTMTEETSRGLALKRTWEKLHTARENRG